jgi:histidinol-phosphate aminotransferase
MSNENLEPPAPGVVEAVAAAARTANYYPSTTPRLRAQLAALHGVTPESIVLGAGAGEVIDATIRAFAAADDEVIVPAPTWPVYQRRIAAVVGRPREVSLCVRRGVYHYDAERFLHALTSRTKLIIVCSPNNPTGNVIPAGDLARLAESGCPLLVDSAYDDYAVGPDRLDLRAAGRLVSAFGNVIVARTFSKAYSLAGLRVGYLLGAPQMLEHIERMMLPGGCVSNVALAAGQAALDDEAYHFAHVETIIRERERLTRGLRERGLLALPSFGNFVPVLADTLPGKASWLVEELFAHKIAVRGMSEDLVRITVGRRSDNDAVLEAAKSLRLVP